MKLFFIVPLLFFVSCTQGSCINVVVNQPSAVQPSKKKEFDEKYLSVARLLIKGKDNPKSGFSATGFAVDKNHILTAGHFCESFIKGLANGEVVNSIEALYFNGDNFKKKNGYKVVRVDNKNDICLLKRGWHSLSVVSFGLNAGVGDKVSVLGAPIGIFPSKVDGYIIQPNNRIYGDKSLIGTLMISAVVHPGNSGSPIYNKNNKVVGMLIGVIGPIGVAVRASALSLFLKSCGIEVRNN